MRQYILAILTLVECLVDAQINYTTNPDLCVHSQGYKDCISTLNNEYASCIVDDPSNIQKGIACKLAAERLSLDCIYENCWNVIWGTV
ncbi:hypothetical protein BTJ68_13502 [Hortaea werneckii EXF-2000]|uniref:Extracellular membrane protein CFEM domain-containing protein n=1 Tax=Hortaea werneckii EXF-2000 TaxID=1157616 RepID=A0A1Z5STI7_HORWE|nr:hypothetical protein BTJ68_13502 [Hortaea werneckii EXF-2000]